MLWEVTGRGGDDKWMSDDGFFVITLFLFTAFGMLHCLFGNTNFGEELSVLFSILCLSRPRSGRHYLLVQP